MAPPKHTDAATAKLVDKLDTDLTALTRTVAALSQRVAALEIAPPRWGGLKPEKETQS